MPCVLQSDEIESPVDIYYFNLCDFNDKYVSIFKGFKLLVQFSAAFCREQLQCEIAH